MSMFLHSFQCFISNLYSSYYTAVVVYCLPYLATNPRGRVRIQVWGGGRQSTLLVISPTLLDDEINTLGNLGGINPVATLKLYPYGSYPPQAQSPERGRWSLIPSTVILYAPNLASCCYRLFPPLYYQHIFLTIVLIVFLSSTFPSLFLDPPFIH